MDKEKDQKELFEEFEKPKKPFSRFSNIFPRSDTQRHFAITLTLEKTVLVTIGIIMAMVIVYALGVEMGKSTVKDKSLLNINNKRRSYKPAERLPIKEKRPPAMTKRGALDARAAMPGSGRPYTITAVTFKNKDVAAEEAGRLKKEGFDAFVKQSGKYFLVCIGAYSGKDSAKTVLRKVRRKYRDAYIILR